MQEGLCHGLLQPGKNARAHGCSHRCGERGVDEDQPLDLAAEQSRIATAEGKHRHAADAVADQDDRSVGTLRQQMQALRESLDFVNAIAEGCGRAQSRQVPQEKAEVRPQPPSDMVPGAGVEAPAMGEHQHRGADRSFGLDMKDGAMDAGKVLA